MDQPTIADIILDNFIKIATLLSSLATFATIFIVYKQRKDSFRPKLLIRFDPNQNIVIQNHSFINTSTGKALSFDIINSGNGLAENISYECTINENQMFKYLMTLGGSSFNYSFKNTWYCIEHPTHKDYYIPQKTFKLPGEYSTLMDLKTDNSSRIQLPFDFTYLKFIDAVEHVIKYGNITDRINLLDFPKAIYSIKYENTENNKYKINYALSVHRINPTEYQFFFKKLK